MIGNSDGDTQVELEDGEDRTEPLEDAPLEDAPLGDASVGDDTTADAANVGGVPQIRVHAGHTVPLPHVKETVAAETAHPWVAPPSGPALSLEQYAYLYAAKLSGAEAMTAALEETGLDRARYAAWQTHWESRMMHEEDDRTRFFALVAKLRS